MTPQPILDEAPRDPPATDHAIGELCFGGDWACAHGDFSALRDIAQRLATRCTEPLHCRLIALGDACLSEPERAVASWVRLKDDLRPQPGASTGLEVEAE